MLGSHRLGAIIEVWRLATKLFDGCACMVRWPAILLKLKLVVCLWLYKNVKYIGDRKFIEVYLCQKWS